MKVVLKAEVDDLQQGYVIKWILVHKCTEKISHLNVATV